MFEKKDKKEQTKANTSIKKPLLYTNIGVIKEKEYLVENLSLLVGSGMGILTALDAIAKEMHTSKMKYLMAILREDIEGGSSIWRALEKTKLFPDHVLSLVRIGEETGKLTENLQIIAIQEEKEKSFRSKIKSAMMYPVFVLLVTAVVGIGIAWFILPRLSQVFSDLKIELPLVTQILISVGNYLGKNGSWLIPLVLSIIIFVFYFLFFFSRTKFIGQAILFRLPGVKKLIMQIELARFGYMLGTLLESGLPIIAALDSLHRATIFPGYKKVYGHLRDQIEEGNSFQKCFLLNPKSSKYVPIPIQQLIIAGERSGKLTEILIRIGKRFEAKIEVTTKNLSTVLEPILLVVVWLGVVAVAMAVILPIYSLVGGLETETSSPAPPPPPAAEETMQPTEIEEIEKEVVIYQLEILSTGSGFLNVRSGPSTAYEKVAQVKPSEIYQYLAIKDNWYQIVFDQNEEDLKIGWVIGTYVEIIEEEKNNETE